MPEQGDGPFREHLLEEARHWRRDGLIGERAYRAILARYGLALDEDKPHVSRLTSIIAVLGGVLVGVGIILFVASNWQGIPRLAKVALLLSVLAVSLAAALRARFGRGHPWVATAMLVLSALIYGAGVFLVGQAYHVPAGEPLLLLLWALGVLPMGYAAASRGVLVIGALAGLLWFQSAVGQTVDSVPLTQLATAVMGAVILSIGEIHRSIESLRGLAGPYVMTGLIATLVAFLLLSFSFIWDFFFVAGPVPALFWVSVVLAVAAAAVMARRWRSARAMQLEAAGILVVVIASAWSMAIAASPGSPSVPPEALGYDGFVPVGGGGFSYPILFNVLLAAAILGAVLVGLATNRNAFVNTGLVFFGLLVLARYFDFSFTLFDRSVVFIGAGILLLVTSYGLARLQRRLVRRVPEGNGP